MKLIPYGKQHIDRDDVVSVVKALKSDKITTGTQVLKFEEQAKKYLNCKYLISCSSGTSALYLALKSINLKSNDVVIMPSMTFVASYNVARILGCKIYLADIDIKSGQMSPEKIIECCNINKIKKEKAIIVMYNSGYPENAERFIKLKKKYGAIIIEDACHALGSSYKTDKNFFKIGSCQHADISTFSLHPLKTITSGEGGIVTTNSSKIFEKIKLLRSHGIKRNLKKHWHYDVEYNSLNFRLSDIQCALALSQLKKINKFIKKRKKISDLYDKFLSKIKLVKINKHNDKYKSSFHLYQIQINSKKNIKEKLFKYMLKNKVILQYHYIPLYKFKVFEQNLSFENTDEYYKKSISLPIYYDLNLRDQMYIINKLRDFFKSIH